VILVSKAVFLLQHGQTHTKIQMQLITLLITILIHWLPLVW